MRISSLIIVMLIGYVVMPHYSHAQLPQQNVNIQAAHEQLRQIREALDRSPRGKEPILKHRGQYTGNNPQLYNLLRLEERWGPEIVGGFGYRPTPEPSFPEIQFFKKEEPATLSARIDALLHGITDALPAEFDLYGYEMRRYMASISGSGVINDKERLNEEIANTKRARIILDYWSKEIFAEISAIEELLNDENNKVDPSTRSSFKFKSGKARAFIVEAGSWIDNNQKTLEHLILVHDQYQYEEPTFNFRHREDLNRYRNLFRARQKALEIIHAYPPFRMMVY